MAQRQIPPERQGIYYSGMGLSILGGLLFASVFVSGIMHFGDFTDFEARTRSEGVRAMLGMALMVVGAVLSNVGRLGLSGSGIKLDPEEARRDVEPWSRMSGGMLKDTLDEAGIKFGGQGSDALPFDERLRRLQKLRDENLISAQEYEDTKKRILESA